MELFKVVVSKSDLDRLIDASVERAVARKLEDVDPISEPPKEWLTNKEAQEFLDLSRATLQRYRNSGTLPYSKIGSKIYYRYEDIVAVLKEHQV